MKPRVLVVTPRYPFPVIGGDRLRIVQVAQALSDRFALDLVSLSDVPEEQLPPAPAGEHPFGRIDCVHLPHWRSIWNCLLALPTRTPLQIAFYRSPAFARLVAERAPRYDALLFHLARTVPYCPRGPRPPAVVELTDAISLNYHRIRTTQGVHGLRSVVFGLEQPRIARYEAELLRQVDLGVLVSPVDRAYLAGHAPESREKLMVCANGIDLSRYPQHPHEASSTTVAFVGNLHSLQNFDAALWFAREVLPRLRATDPRFVFKVIGRIPPREQAQLARLEGVQVTGEVAEISSHLAHALCGVCPIRLGAGIQNKILEYMASGLPALVSTVGLEGLKARVGDEVILADRPEQYVHTILDLRAGRLDGVRLAQAARRYVERHHNWQRNLQPLVDTMARMIRTPPLSGT